MPDINWGGDSSTAPFSSRLDETAGNFILAEDNSGGTVLLEWDGTTWQYRGPVDMNGEDISGVATLTATDATVSGTVDAGAVSTETAVTTLRPLPHTFTIFRDTDYVYSLDRAGEIVAGGPDSVGVSDATDFAEIYAYLVNDAPISGSPRPYMSIYIAPTTNTNRPAKYVAKSTQQLKYQHALFGAGKNRTIVYGSDAVAGSTVFEFNLDSTAAQNIHRMENVKFDGRHVDDIGGTALSGFPDTWFGLPSANYRMNELNITNSEFRSCQSYGIDIRSIQAYNYLTNTWFVDGADLRLDGFGDLQLIGLQAPTATVELNNGSQLIRRGNEVNNWSINSTTYERADEEFGTVDADRGVFGGGSAIREMGTVDHGSVGGTSVSTVSVTFDTSYSTAPSVIHSMGDTGPLNQFGTGDLVCEADNIDTNGFRSVAYNPDSNSQTFNRCGYLVIE
jgi:hypothetical protein